MAWSVAVSSAEECGAARSPAGSPARRVAWRHALVLLAFLQLLVRSAGAASGAEGSEAAGTGSRGAGDAEEEEQCSKALGFNETSGPKDRGYQDLQACDEHHKRTCCERNHTAKVRAAWLAFSMERSPRCAKMSQLALCSVCDGDVGVGAQSTANLVHLCPSFCKRWYQACAEDYFAPAAAAGLQPCGPSSLSCSPLDEITEDFADFCARISAPLGAVFSVAAEEDEPESCFDGVPAWRSRGKAEKAPWIRAERRSYTGSWWRRMLPAGMVRMISSALDSSGSQVVEQLQDSAPGFIIALVAAFFGWYLWNSRD